MTRKQQRPRQQQSSSLLLSSSSTTWFLLHLQLQLLLLLLLLQVVTNNYTTTSVQVFGFTIATTSTRRTGGTVTVSLSRSTLNTGITNSKTQLCINHPSSSSSSLYLSVSNDDSTMSNTTTTTTTTTATATKNATDSTVNQKEEENIIIQNDIDTNSESTSKGSTSSTNTNTTATATTEIVYEFELHESISNIKEDDWNRCIGNNCNPFLSYSWLYCLELSNCVSYKTGWGPQHITIHETTTTSTTTSTGTTNNTTKIIGVVPMYIKGNSYGEFIFDQSFANAAYQMNIQYYPKLLVGIPFTPVSTVKFNYDLFTDTTDNDNNNNEEDKLKKSRVLNNAIGQFLKSIAISNKISSVHVNFITDTEAEQLSGKSLYLPQTQTSSDNDDNDETTDTDRNSVKEKNAEKIRRLLFGLRQPKQPTIKDEYLRRTSIQYHWYNENPFNNNLPYTTFDDYLSCFKSKKRINIKRERRIVLIDNNITIRVLAGQDILKYNTNNNNQMIRKMFSIYVSTIEKMSIYGRQYLSYNFFERIVQTNFINYFVFVCACKPSSTSSTSTNTNTDTNTDDDFNPDDIIAGTINVVKDGVFYGRYWGCLPQYDIKNLHFETCYWSAIDYCIQNNISRMEPGAGGGDYKWARGFNPSLIHSAHYICNPNLRRSIDNFLQYETEDNIELTEYLRGKSSVIA